MICPITVDLDGLIERRAKHMSVLRNLEFR